MKLISRLFRKSPPPAPPAPPTVPQRIASLQEAPADVVVRTALGDDAAGMRVAAVGLLPDGETLRTLAGLADPPPAGAAARAPQAVRHAAQQRLAQLIDAGSIDFAAFYADRARLSESLTVAALCADPARLRHAVARIDDPAVLASLVTDSPSSRVRQSAAQAIEDPAQLHELLPRVRGKDKTVYKLIRQKCDALVAERRLAEEAVREAEALCASLERHGARPHDALYAATLEALTTRWRALPANTDAQVLERGRLALARCGDVVATHAREAALQAAAQAARLAAQQEAEREAHAAREREREAQQQAAAQVAEADHEALAAASAARSANDEARAERRAAEAQALAQIGGLIRLCGGALHAGNSRKAARFRQSLEEAMQGAPALPDYLARNLQQLDERLNELRQWKDYVVAPKRIELIEEMEALVGSDEAPEALAEHIRSLQQEWRTINKGIASDASAEAERFQLAYHAAFKPCQAHFAAQAAVRRENLEARRQVLERLKAFTASLDAENTDYALVLQVLREAPLEWRSHFPVDRDAGRAAEAELHESLDRLRAVLSAWHERNAAQKASLIAQARHLTTIEDTTQAIDGVKRLQTSWKETGPVARDQSQTLWDEFRTLCDAVYARREQAYAQYSAALDSTRAQVLALCEQVEQACAQPPADRSAAHARTREWQAAFDALGELPRADAHSLRDRFERALARYDAGLSQQDRRDAEAAGENLFEAARHVRAYERAVLQDVPEREALRTAAEDFIAGVPRWPRGGLQALKQALARAHSAQAGSDDAARERALRTLCVRSEILSSMPTPVEDEELRRDFQMRLLMQGLGQASHADDEDWDAMRLEWIGSGAVAPELHEVLERRFRHSLANRPAPEAPELAFRQHDGRDRRADRERDRGEQQSRRDRPGSGGRR